MVDDLLSILLRYFRGHNVLQASFTEREVQKADLDFLVLAWARSAKPTLLLTDFADHPNEIRRGVRAEVANSSLPRGPIRTTPSVLRQLITGNAASWSYSERRHTEATSLNAVLAFVLSRVLDCATVLADTAGDSTVGSSIIPWAVRVIESRRQIERLVDASRTSADLNLTQAAKECLRSRAKLYVSAGSCFEELAALMAGEWAVIANVLLETVLGPQEDWRLFELWALLRISSEIAMQTGYDLQLSRSFATSSGPVVTIGPFEVLWQSHGPDCLNYVDEPREAKAKHILSAYGFRDADDRPDIVVLKESRTVAILEAKYFASADPTAWRDPFAQGVYQLVRYSARYGDSGSQNSVLEKSAVILSACDSVAYVRVDGSPSRLGARDINGPRFSDYISAIIAA